MMTNLFTCFAYFNLVHLAIALYCRSVCSFVIPCEKSLNRASHGSCQRLYFFKGKRRTVANRADEQEEERTYPEAKAATYEMLSSNPVGIEFGSLGLVRPLLKQTQLEKRKLQVVYDANKHGWDAKAFHNRVDGKGASIVLAKVRGLWIGGYNPRGWASLGGSRPSIAAFLFYQKFPLFGGFQKLRSKGNGGLAISRDEFDQGIFFGADGLVIPLSTQGDSKSVASRLGSYFESIPKNKSTLLPIAGANARLEELQVISGVYAPGEGIPCSF